MKNYFQTTQGRQLIKFPKCITGILFFLLMVTGQKSFGQIVAWNMTGVPQIPTTVNATTNNANLNTAVLSRGAGVTPASLTNGFSGSNWVDASEAAAITNNRYNQITIAANATYKVSLSTLDERLRRSSTGPNAYRWWYSLDGTNFTAIGTAVSFTTTGSTGDNQLQIVLSGIGALQDVASGTTITLRLYAWGATGAAGTLAFGTTNVNSLAIGGTVALIATGPTISNFSPTNACSGSGASVVITGTDFTGATNVSFNGTSATFVVDNANQITATLPAGATTGPITVTTPAGTATSSTNFTVNTAPVITCPLNISVNNTTGLCGANVSFAATATGTPAPTFSYVPASGSFFPVGTPTTVTATATNVCGFQSCTFTVTVTDNQPPTAVCQNATVTLDALGNGTLTIAQVNSGSSDNCAIQSMSLSQTSFNCSHINPVVGPPTAWINEFHYDNASTDAGEFIEIAGNAGLNLAGWSIVLYNGSGGAPYTTSLLSGTIPNQSNGFGTVVVSYPTNGIENGAPDGIALVDNGTVIQFLSYEGSFTAVGGPANGMLSVDIVVTEPATTPIGHSLQLTGSGSSYASFTWLPPAANTSGAPNTGQTFIAPGNPVTLTVNDVNGNSSTCSATVYVVDNTPPTATCQNATVILNASGNGSVSAAQINNGSSDNCGTVNLVSVSPSAFTCFNVGPNTVTLTINDGNGNTNTCTATVTVVDNIPPTAVCQNATVILDASGNGTLTVAQVNNGSSDNCAIQNMSLSQTMFNCSHVTPVSGPPSAWINEFHYDNTSTDAGEFIEIAGNSGLDLTGWSIVLYNGANGLSYGTTTLSGILSNQSNGFGFMVVTYPVNGIENGSPDGIALVNNSSSVVQFLSYEGSFTAVGGPANGMLSVDIGVTETGTTLVGNSLQLTGTGTGYASFTWATPAANTSGALNNGQTFIAPVGNTVTLTVTDVNGLSSTCTAIVTVNDVTPPVANCQNITVQLNASGTVTVTGAQVNNGSTDACGIASYSVLPNTFTCANVGSSNPVTLTVTDVNGLSSTCTATVTVQDLIPPVANCQNLTVQLNAGGTASITASQINNGSTDACGLNPTMTVSPSTFTCSDVTPPLGSLSVWINEFHYDNTGADAGEFIEIAGNLGINLTGWSVVLYNGAGNAPYGTSSLSGTLTNQSNGFGFTVLNIPGLQNGSPDGIALVDNFNNVVQFLSYEGTITAAGGPANGMTSVDIGISENGSGAVGNSLRLTGTGSSYASFTWAPEAPSTPGTVNTGQTFVAPANIVTLTVTDVNGNSSTCTAYVTVQDLISPVITTGTIASCYLTVAAAEAAALAATSATDNCPGIIYAASTVGTCSAIITVTATDASGNQSSTTYTTSIDNTGPVITTGTITACYPTVAAAEAAALAATSATDDCPGAITYAAGTVGTCSAVITVTATDACGNPSSTTYTTSIDNTGPVITCPADIVVNNTTGFCGANVPYAATATDVCSVPNITYSIAPGTFFVVGTTSVTATATDACGNATSCIFTVTVAEASMAADSIESNRQYDNICAGESITLTRFGGQLSSGPGAQWEWHSGSCNGPLVASGVDFITVSPAATTTYYLKAVSTCNPSGTACVSLTVVVSTAPPPNSLTITYAPAFGYIGLIDVITVNSDPNVVYYSWSKNQPNNPAVLIGGNFLPTQTISNSPSIQFTQTQQNYNIRVIAVNACGRSNSAHVRIRGTVGPAPGITSLDGTLVACAGSTHTYTSGTIPGTSGYFWTLDGSTVGIVTQGNQTVDVTFPAGFTSGQLCVHGQTNFNLNGPDYCITISNTPATPGTISGIAAPCQGGTATYTIVAVPGATSYNWTTPGISPTTIVNNGTSANITFPIGSFTGSVCVTAGTGCGPSSASSCLSPVTAGTVVSVGPITGEDAGVCGINTGTGVGYEVPNNPSVISWSWTVPPGASINTGQGSSAINVYFTNSYGGGNISVVAEFLCGFASASLAVTGAPAFVLPPPPPPPVTPALACSPDFVTYTAVAFGISNTYAWTITNGDPVTINGDGSIIDILWNLTGTRAYTVTASNTCGSSVPYSQSVSCRISGDQNLIDKLSAQVYPNPTHSNITLEFNSPASETYVVKVTDVTGRLIITEAINASAGLNQHKMDFSTTAKGMYLLNLQNQSGENLLIRVAVE